MIKTLTFVRHSVDHLKTSDPLTTSSHHSKYHTHHAIMFAVSLQFAINLLLFRSSYLANGLKINSIGVPSAIFNSSSVVLSCHYDLQGDQLYSVKWYKDYVEFYRYQPDYTTTQQTITTTIATTTQMYSSDNDNLYDTTSTKSNNYNNQNDETPTTNPSSSINRQRYTVTPQIASKYDYDLNGIYLNVALSNATHAYLSSTNLQSEGTYKCEVSVDGPSFVTVSAERQMKVYVLPKSKLAIHNNRQPASRSIFINQQHQHQPAGLVYDLNETVNLTCTIGLSKPRALLEWYINDSKAPEEYVQSSSEIRPTSSNGFNGGGGGDITSGRQAITNAINLGKSKSIYSSTANSFADSLPSESSLIFQLEHYYLRQPHQQLALLKSLRIKCVARLTLEYSFESNIVVAGGKTIKKQITNSMPSVINSSSIPASSTQSSLSLPLVMIRSPETFSHNIVGPSQALSPNTQIASIYLWPQKGVSSIIRSSSSSAASNSNSWRQQSGDQSLQQQLYIHNSNNNNNPAAQADQGHYVRNRDFIANSQWSNNANARDFSNQQQSMTELNEHISYIQKLLIAFAPNEASQPEIEATTHKLSSEEYDLNDIIKFDCISSNHVQLRPPAQMRLKWFINNLEIVTAKINRYSNGRFYYETNSEEENQRNTTNTSNLEPGDDARGNHQPSDGASLEQQDQRQEFVQPINSMKQLRSKSFIMTSIGQHHRDKHLQQQQQQHQYKTTQTMRAMVNYQQNPVSELTNEQTVPKSEQMDPTPLDVPMSTRLPQPVSIIRSEEEASHISAFNDDGLLGRTKREERQQSHNSYDYTTRKNDPNLDHARSSRSNNYRSSFSQKQQDNEQYKQQQQQQMKQSRQKQTIPLEIELHNSLYQLKELDIKCLLIVEQPIVEYNAHLTITNTPTNNAALKPSIIQQQSTNQRIVTNNQASYSDTNGGLHFRPTNINGQTQQSASSCASIHSNGSFLLLSCTNKIMSILVLVHYLMLLSIRRNHNLI